MTQRPIPAFYCVYLLRSTVRPASLYIGSTPNPRRRLSQHNEKGGANRTSRVSLRPWEMVCIVTGFPSNIAALQFEWAWQHPHRSLKIPTSFLEERGYTRKGSLGRKTLKQKLANLHLLAQVDAFSRWPLSIRFFAQDVFLLWEACCATQPGTLRRMIQVILDVRKKEDAETQEGGEDDDEIPPSSQRAKKKLKPTKHAATGNGGLQGLDLTYRRLDPYFQKVRTLLVLDHDLTCNICQGKLEENHSFTAVCPRAFCEHVTHLKCLAQEFLDQEETPQDSGGVQAQMTKILPTGGNCPGCRKWTEWGDVVREISVRTRTNAKDSAKEDEEDEEDLGISAADMADVLPGMEGGVSEWGDDTDMESVISDAGSDTGSVRRGGGGGGGGGRGGGKGKGKEPAKRKVGRPKKRLSTVAEDSDWDNVETIL